MGIPAAFLVRSLLAATLTLLAARPAHAETPRDPAAAEALFAESQRLMESGDYAAACPKLEESYRLDPATGALYALAICHERQGRHASAWVEFMGAAARASAERYAERERSAREHAAALEARLSFLTVRLVAETAQLDGISVSRNGVALGAAAWGTSIPLDPGQYVVVAEAPGHQRWSTTVSIGDAPQRASVLVPRLVPLPAKRPAPTAKQPPATAPRAPEEPALQLLGVPFTPLRVAGVALGAAALTSFGLATFSLVRALDQHAESKETCLNNACPPEGERARLGAVEAANLATVGAITGVVLLSAGVGLFLLGGPEKKPSASLSFSPAGVRVRARF